MKKGLVIFLVLGLIGLAGGAFAQDPYNTANDNIGSAVAQDESTAVDVTVDDTGAAANETSTAINVEGAGANDNSTAQEGMVNANSGTATGQSGEANANDNSTAQDGQVNANSGTATAQEADAAASDNSKAQDAQAAGMDNAVVNNNDGGIQIVDPAISDNQLALGEAVAHNGSTATSQDNVDTVGPVAKDSNDAVVGNLGPVAKDNQANDNVAAGGSVAKDSTVNDNVVAGEDAFNIRDNTTTTTLTDNVAAGNDALVVRDNTTTVSDNVAAGGSVAKDSTVNDNVVAGEDALVVRDNTTTVTDNVVAGGDAFNIRDNTTTVTDNNAALAGEDALAGNGSLQANDNFADDVIVGDSNKNMEAGDFASMDSFNGTGPNNVGSGTQVIVPDASLQLGLGPMADDGSTALDESVQAQDYAQVANFTGAHDTAALGGSVALGGEDNMNAYSGTNNMNEDGIQIVNPALQDNQVQFAGGDANVAKSNTGNTNTGSGTQVVIPDATVQALGKNMADDSSAVTDNSSTATSLNFGSGNAVSATDSGRAIVSDDGAVAMDGSTANSISDVYNGGSAAIGGTTAIAGVEDSIVASGGNNLNNVDDSLVGFGGTNNYNDSGTQLVNPAVQNGQLIQDADDVMAANNSSKIQDGQVNAMDSGVAKNQDGQVNAMDSGVAKNQDGQVNAMDSAVATANNQDGIGNVQNGGTATTQLGLVNLMGDARIQFADDDAAIGNDSAQVVSDPSNSAVAQGAGVAINNTTDSAFTTGDNSPALRNNEDFAISNSGPALNDNEDFAISTSGPALNNVEDFAVADNSGVAFQDVTNAAVVGAGNNAQDISSSAVAQGSIAANNVSSAALADNYGFAVENSGTAAVSQSGSAALNLGSGTLVQGGGTAFTLNAPGNAFTTGAGDAMVNNAGIQVKNGDAFLNNADGAMAKNGNAIAAKDNAVVANNSKAVSNPQADVNIDSTQVRDSGQLAVGNVGGLNLNAQVPVVTNPMNAVQTVALTELKQVNAGVYVGNNSANSSGYLNVSNSNSAQSGVLVNANNLGGVAVNNAAQNVINVSANIGQQ